MNAEVENTKKENSKFSLKKLRQDRGLGENWKETNKEHPSNINLTEKIKKDPVKNNEFEKFQERMTSAFDKISEAQKKLLDNMEKFFEQKKEMLEKNDDDFLKELIIVLLSQKNQQGIGELNAKSMDQNKAL